MLNKNSYKETALIPNLMQLKAQDFFKQAVLVVLGSAFIALMAQVSVPMKPVPVSGQTFAVLLIGLCFGSRLTLLTLLAYYAEGLMGLPVFAGGAFGAASFATPSAGYLLAFLPAAMFCALAVESGKERSWQSLMSVLLLGHAIIFALGLAWLAMFVGFGVQLLHLGLIPFLPGMLIKIGLTFAVYKSMYLAVDQLKS